MWKTLWILHMTISWSNYEATHWNVQMKCIPLFRGTKLMKKIPSVGTRQSDRLKLISNWVCIDYEVAFGEYIKSWLPSFCHGAHCKCNPLILHLPCITLIVNDCVAKITTGGERPCYYLQYAINECEGYHCWYQIVFQCILFEVVFCPLWMVGKKGNAMQCLFFSLLLVILISH